MKKLIFYVCVAWLPQFFNGCARGIREKETFARHVGVYVLDLDRTELGGYTSDSSLYKELKITFREDSTFSTNMQVPFFADSLGTWKAGDGLPDGYNQIFFQNKNYESLEGTQFFPSFTDGIDTIFLIIGASAKKNMPNIEKIYFRKLSR